MVVAIFAQDQPDAPLPLDSLGRKLCETFSYLWQPIIGENEPDPQWQTITKYPMRPRVLWKVWQDTTQLIGVRFDSQTYYALIDLDRDSLYHPSQNPNALKLIRAALETIGVYRTVLIRSSFSGGLHLYIPLPVSVPTFGLASAIKQCLEAQGLDVKAGQLEIFPNCKAFAIPGTYTEYNAHRLPLQPQSGSCLLNDDCNPIPGELGRFFESWDVAAAGQCLEELQGAIIIARSNNKARRHRRATVVDDWLNDLRTEMQDGWTGYGQTNHLLKTIACYGVVFEGLKGDALAEFVHETAINSPGYERWCRHQHEIGLRTTVWARSAEGYYWALGDAPKRSGTIHSTAANNVVPFNLTRSEDAQRRIRETVKRLEQEGQLPSTATARAKTISEQGISLRTLYRHLNLWHPTHYQADHLRSCKTSEPEPVSTIYERNLENPLKVAEPCHSKEFYTIKKNMKCEHFETQSLCDPTLNFSFPISEIQSGSPSILFSQTDQSPRRFPFVESVTISRQVEALKLFLAKGFENRTVTPSAKRDHPSVLVKLLQLWMDGYENWVRLLRRIE